MNSVQSVRRYSIPWLIAAALATLLSLGQLPALAIGTASISGTVTVPAGTDPTTVFVDAVPAAQDGPSVVSTQLSADGTYSLSGLDAGSYKVIVDPGPGSAVEAQWYDGKYSFETATPIALADAQAKVGVNFVLVTGASISGVVTAPAGVDLTDVLVVAHDNTMAVAATAAVGIDGAYRVTGLPAGDYRLNFTSQESGLEPEWYNNQASFDTATTISLARGEAFTAEPVQMVSGGSISGTVTVPAGVDPAEVRVSISQALNEFQWAGNTVVGADGTYSVTGLPAGSYKVQFTGGTGVLPLWYGGQSTFDAATVISVAASTAVTGIDVTLSAAATISGVVSVPTIPTPYVINDLTVAAHNTDTGNISPAYVLPDGSYTVGPLVAGTYKLHFVDGRSVLKDQWFAGKATQDTADVLTVTDGQALTGQNITMAYPVLPAATNVTPPVIAGQAIVGKTLSVTPGTWNPAAGPGSLSYMWLRNNAPISGATASTYVPTVSDAGQSITVQETMTAPGYRPSTHISAVVKPTGIFASVTAPKITGTAAVGYTLRATATMPSPAASIVRYRWLRNGVLISGAYASTYKLTAMDIGKQIRSKVYFLRPGYRTVAPTSTAVIPKAVFTGLKAPVVSGIPTVGYSLKSTITKPSPAPSAIGYRWLRNGVVIARATGSTYRLTALERGKQIRSKVYFLRSGYLTAAVVSGYKLVR